MSGKPFKVLLLPWLWDLCGGRENNHNNPCQLLVVHQGEGDKWLVTVAYGAKFTWGNLSQTLERTVDLWDCENECSWYMQVVFQMSLVLQSPTGPALTAMEQAAMRVSPACSSLSPYVKPHPTNQSLD